MLFNSTDFLLFYLAVLAVYWGLAVTGAWRLRKVVLLVASYLFYASWSPPFVLLLLATTLVDFSVALRLRAAASARRRRQWILLSLTANLGVLAYFKYGRFLFENVWWAFGDTSSMPAFLQITLPLGISFYTFQSVSYTIDVYRGVVAPTRSFPDFALYVAFFPQLVAGPIVRAGTFLPQLARSRRVSSADAERALMLIALGLFKKVVCADVLGEYVDQVFGAIDQHRGLNLLVAIYAYAFQIYFDFSGYSDMAIGLAALLGFHLPVNFHLPYAAQNPSEFWQRWHISLSTWLRDYLYIPLGGNRHGEAWTYRNLMITMLLGGLWHGAAWHFVAWGAYHGLLLVGHRRYLLARPRRETPLAVLLRRLAMFHLACAGWVFFRAPSLAESIRFFRNLLEPGLVVSPTFLRALAWSAAALAIHQLVADRRPGRVFLESPPLLQATVYAAVVVLVFLFSPTSQRFIYFQF
jgi:alginate O-acetyltransferase complex protein AlgI